MEPTQTPLVEKFIVNAVSQPVNSNNDSISYLKQVHNNGNIYFEWVPNKTAATRFNTYPDAATGINSVATFGTVYQVEKIFVKP